METEYVPMYINYKGKEYERVCSRRTKKETSQAVKLARSRGFLIQVRNYTHLTYPGGRKSTMYVVYVRKPTQR